MLNKKQYVNIIMNEFCLVNKLSEINHFSVIKTLLPV